MALLSRCVNFGDFVLSIRFGWTSRREAKKKADDLFRAAVTAGHTFHEIILCIDLPICWAHAIGCCIAAKWSCIFSHSISSTTYGFGESSSMWTIYRRRLHAETYQKQSHGVRTWLQAGCITKRSGSMSSVISDSFPLHHFGIALDSDLTAFTKCFWSQVRGGSHFFVIWRTHEA